MLANKHEIDRAIADLAAAIRLDPQEKLGYKNRAAAYKIKRDWDRAIADYGEAIRLDPNDINIIYARGAAYLSKQDCDRAIGDFLCGMTDRYAMRLYQELRLPKPWTVY